MNQLLRAWLTVIAILLLCAGSIWFAAHYRARRVNDGSSLLARLPGKDAILLSIDFGALRRAGLLQLLANSKTPEEPEYKQFVGKTDFNYTEDLDAAMASFGPTGKYFLLRGRFDWSRLRAYAASENGACANSVCRMTGSTPERKISFFPLRPELMAMSVSGDSEAVLRMTSQAADHRVVEAPMDPVWVSFPAAALKATDLPAGTQMFAESVRDAEEVTLSLGPEGKDFQVTAAVRCRSEQDAAAVMGQLEKATALLRSLIERENKAPNPRDLSGSLTAGSFSRQDRRVFGRWPLARAYVEGTLSGGTR